MVVPPEGDGRASIQLLSSPRRSERRIQIARRGSVLLDDPRRLQGADEGQRGAVHSGHFRLVDVDLAVVDPQARQRRHHVLDHVHARLAGAEHGPQRTLRAVGDRGGDARAAGQIGADKDDPGPRRRRPKLHAHVPPSPVADPFNCRRGGYRSLVACPIHGKRSVVHDKERD